MSYSSALKSTLSAIEVQDEAVKIAELYGFLHSAASVTFSAGTVQLTFLCDSAAVSRRYFAIIKDIFGITPVLGVKKGSAFSRGNRYLLMFTSTDEAAELLSFYHIYDLFENTFNEKIDPAFLNATSARQAYMRGVFFGCGYMADPTKSYRLTLNLNHRARCEELRFLLENDGVKSKILSREEHISIVIKERESIATFLAMIGAHKAMLDFESLLTVKDFKNDTVRMINSETANIDKTASTAARQIDAIQRIIDQGNFSALNDKLVEAAQLRMDHPELPLSALCTLFKPPISKSAAYKRYTQIEKIAASRSAQSKK